jgi:hypothetical protein
MVRLALAVGVKREVVQALVIAGEQRVRVGLH